MQARLNALQNPSKSCSDVKRLSCNINKGCGYGCEIHHAMHCFHVAYALGRPLILFSGILIGVLVLDLMICSRWMEVQPARWI